MIFVCGYFFDASGRCEYSIVVVMTHETVLVLTLVCGWTSHWNSVVVSVEISVGLLLILKEIIYFLIVLETAITRDRPEVARRRCSRHISILFMHGEVSALATLMIRAIGRGSTLLIGIIYDDLVLTNAALTINLISIGLDHAGMDTSRDNFDELRGLSCVL
jgi:hypothetical protein